jgi:hypothetical protein
MTSKDEKRTGYLVRDAPADVVRVRSSRPPSAPPAPDGESRTSGVRTRVDADDFESFGADALHAPPAPLPRIEATSDHFPPLSSTATQHAERLVQELMAAPPDSEQAFLPRLFRLEHVGLRALHDHFPGPLWCDPRRPYTRLPHARQLSAIASCLVAWGEPAIPYVTSLLDAPHPDVRLFAVVVARDLQFRAMLESLARLSIAGDPIARKAALEVLPDFASLPEYPIALDRFRALLPDRTTQQSYRLRAIQCAEELRDASAVPELVELLAESDRELARAAHAALRRLTAHDLGTLRFGWHRFLRSFSGRPRFVWLLEGLVDRRAELRAIASEELARLTGHAPPLPVEASRDEAMRLRTRYEQYWATASRFFAPRDAER